MIHPHDLQKQNLYLVAGHAVQLLHGLADTWAEQCIKCNGSIEKSNEIAIKVEDVCKDKAKVMQSQR